MDLVSCGEVGELSIDQKTEEGDHEYVFDHLFISATHNLRKEGWGGVRKEIWRRKPCALLKQDVAMHSKALRGNTVRSAN
jgi:hypothetical protein